jgi:hypothetical protein
MSKLMLELAVRTFVVVYSSLTLEGLMESATL